MPVEESNRIEFKSCLTDSLESEVIAFLNYQKGGIIYLGVEDSGTVIGLSNTDELQCTIKDKLKNNISPSTLGLFDIVVEEKKKKKIIKIVISSGTEKPYYLKKKGMTPSGCFLRVGSTKEQMTSSMIEELFARRIRNNLKELESPRQCLTFNRLKIYYEEHGLKLGENFLLNLDLLTKDGLYNYNAFLLADVNTISIPVVKYLGVTRK